MVLVMVMVVAIVAVVVFCVGESKQRQHDVPALEHALRLDDEQINHTAAIAARRAQLKSRPPELPRGAHEACTLACGVRRYEVGGVA